MPRAHNGLSGYYVVDVGKTLALYRDQAFLLEWSEILHGVSVDVVVPSTQCVFCDGWLRLCRNGTYECAEVGYADNPLEVEPEWRLCDVGSWRVCGSWLLLHRRFRNGEPSAGSKLVRILSDGRRRWLVYPPGRPGSVLHLALRRASHRPQVVGLPDTCGFGQGFPRDEYAWGFREIPDIELEYRPIPDHKYPWWELPKPDGEE